jgi:hypothetical protein
MPLSAGRAVRLPLARVVRKSRLRRRPLSPRAIFMFLALVFALPGINSPSSVVSERPRQRPCRCRLRRRVRLPRFLLVTSFSGCVAYSAASVASPSDSPQKKP